MSLSIELDNFNLDKRYWTDGKDVFHCNSRIKNIDVETFRHFFGVWAKDKKRCFLGSSILKKADIKTFEVLNLTFAKDKENVWTLGGEIKNVDAESFIVCDDGKMSLGELDLFVPYGFGKDKNNVYYYNYIGKPKVVKKANSENFKSLNDGYFTYDQNFVFCGFTTIPKANPKTWKKLEDKYFYSKDNGKVFYFNKLIKDADYDTFRVVKYSLMSGLPNQYAKDKESGFLNGKRISFEKLIQEVNFYNRISDELKI
ncbi:DKNYY domain-containing protein [Maribacter sp.]|uniref:DKNYY domain-containing protein n=1 Tax=Maribacter sp. TaxID=1897614 RepID=UPI0025BEEE47|nr:DKNYY domain-containing protein [Maribacter sp.]